MRARAAAAAGLAATALALAGCHSLSTRPPDTPVPLAGHWRENPGASDDFDHKLDEALMRERARMRAHRPQMVAGGEGGGAGGQGAAGAAAVPALPQPHEALDREHKRLADDMRPAETLQIALADGSVEITRDSEPVRRFQPGQVVSRIDSSGAASVSSGWDQRAFVIEARYTDRATRSWRLEIDGPTDTLHLRFTASDPDFGQLVINTVYRRAP
jgi:hypothetical protein